MEDYEVKVVAFETAVAIFLLGVTYFFLDVSFKLDEKHYALKLLFLSTGLILVLQNIGIARSMTLFNYTSNITQVQSGIDNYYIIGSFVAILTIFYFFLTYIINLFKDFQKYFVWKEKGFKRRK